MTPKRVFVLKRALLGGWALWWTVVLATNLTDAGKALGWLHDSWVFASGNYAFIVKTTALYGPPSWVNGLLFAGVIAWQGITAILFWVTCLTFRGKSTVGPWLYPAFTAGLTLWLAFAVADEVCIAYALEATHLRLLIAQLATLLAIELLPEAPA
jgi:hypothetical protein